MQEKEAEGVQNEEQYSSDVIAFCALIARILIRCLKEQDPHALQVLSWPSKSKKDQAEGTPTSPVSF